jgi:hypothetical protein
VNNENKDRETFAANAPAIGENEAGELSSLSGLKKIGCKSAKCLGGSYFAVFSTNRITIGLQNPQNLPSPSHFFAAILQARQAASKANLHFMGSPQLNYP